ncbi:MAG: DUF2946 family protein [Phycisphaerales bacterium]
MRTRSSWLGVVAAVFSAWVAILAPLTHTHDHDTQPFVCDSHHHAEHAQTDHPQDHEHDAPEGHDCPLCALLAFLPNTWVMPGAAPSLTPILAASLVIPETTVSFVGLAPALPRPRGPPML